MLLCWKDKPCIRYLKWKRWVSWKWHWVLKHLQTLVALSWFWKAARASEGSFCVMGGRIRTSSKCVRGSWSLQNRLWRRCRLCLSCEPEVALPAESGWETLCEKLLPSFSSQGVAVEPEASRTGKSCAAANQVCSPRAAGELSSSPSTQSLLANPSTKKNSNVYLVLPFFFSKYVQITSEKSLSRFA